MLYLYGANRTMSIDRQYLMLEVAHTDVAAIIVLYKVRGAQTYASRCSEPAISSQLTDRTYTRGSVAQCTMGYGGARSRGDENPNASAWRVCSTRVNAREWSSG